MGMARPYLRVLIVEDNPDDCALIVRLLTRAYVVTHLRVETADAFLVALKEPWDLIIADYSLPRFDAPAALALLQSRSLDVPFIVVSGAIGDESASLLMRAGAHDYVLKDMPFRLLPAVAREIREAHERAAHRQAEIDIIKSYNDLQEAYEKTLEGWAQALALRDRETEGHSQRVTEMTVTLARMMGVDEEEIINVRRGALLHDIGKIGVPDYILHKAGPLDQDEWVQIHAHPQYAYDLLSPIGYLKAALDIPYCHHEHWDGSGYPQGLQGEAIPKAARIFAVVDAHDALRSNRPYRAALSQEAALDEIRRGSGTHFDPSVVSVFCPAIEAGAL